MFLLQNHEQRIESCESTTQVDVNGTSAHMLSRRTPSTLVIIEAMTITVDNLVVREVEEEKEISPRTNRSIRSTGNLDT